MLPTPLSIKNLNNYSKTISTSRAQKETDDNQSSDAQHLPAVKLKRFSTLPHHHTSHLPSLLIHLDGTINLTNEPQAGEEADGAGEHKEGDGHHCHIGEVQRRGHHTLDVQLGHVVPHGVEEEVEAGGARGEEGPPPPLVVLIAQLEVAHHDGDLRAGGHQNN